jgi:hypothetical protein
MSQSPMSMIKGRYRRPVLVSSVIILLIMMILLKPFFDRQLDNWKLLPEHERLTELYFTHPNTLPGYYVPGSSQFVSFTTHNIEYNTTLYSYNIIEQSSDGTQSIIEDSGTFRLRQNQYKYIVDPVKLTNLGKRIKVYVQLTNEHESIDFWLNATS